MENVLQEDNENDLVSPGRSGDNAETGYGPRLLDRVVGVLRAAYHDKDFRDAALPKLAEQFQPRVTQAVSSAQERSVVRDFLSRIPSSHLSLLSAASRRMLENELLGRMQPTLGLQLLAWHGRYFAAMVLPGGPAANSGIRTWDEVRTVDGVAVASSPRLDWRTDDAHLSDLRDPPMHAILVNDGEAVDLGVVRTPTEVRNETLTSVPYSALEGAKRSVELIVHGDVRIGYLRLWYLHMTGVPELIEAALDSTLQASQALVLDLRGRGGSATVVARVLRLLETGTAQRFDGPVVALIDRQARSGKEVLAHELKVRGLATLVGEPTAGAVIPASFADLGDDAVLMFPPMTLPPYTELLELRPTTPHIEISWGGPYSGDTDPIREAGVQQAVQLVAERGPGRVVSRTANAVSNGSETEHIQLLDLAALLDSMSTAIHGVGRSSHSARIIGTGTARIVDTPLAGTYEMEASKETPFRSVMRLAGGIVVVQEVDSSGGVWVGDGSGNKQQVDGGGAAPLRFASTFGTPARFRKLFPTATVEAIELFDNTKCVRVRLVPGTDTPVLLIGIATSLARGLRYQVQTQIGALDAVTYFRSYRNFEGVTIADVTVVEAAGQQTELQLTSVRTKS